MNDQRQAAITKDFETFMRAMQAIEPKLDLPPGVQQFLRLARETAFRAGWAAGQTWQEHHDAEAPTMRMPAPKTVKTLVEVGQRAWVRPLAIVEHMKTGELFVDPRFTTAPSPSDRCCIALVVTSEGLVASGPTDRHRLSPDLDRSRLRPLLRLEAEPVA